MANMKLTQLSTSEFKLDSVEDFCLNSNGNCMVLKGNSNDVTILELMTGCDTTILMPYSINQIAVSQIKPIGKVIKNINLVKIYETGTVQESQELALDPLYTADCATEAIKAKVLEANIITKNNTTICCILTSYGYCEIFQKIFITDEWKPLDTNLSNILIREVFPINDSPSNIKTYNEFKNFVNKYIITCFAISLHLSDIIIYLGTAAGYVIPVKYNKTSCKFEMYCHFKTSLNRITYIVIYNNLILVGCDQGKVLLLKINFESASIQELDYLWSKSDRMCCRKAFFTYSEELQSYLVVFCKTAHVLAYRLDMEGAVVSSSILYVSGIRTTGIESINETEFLITTITCTVKHIKILCPTKQELIIEEQVVDNDFDSGNYQILGLATSSSKNLWSFLLYRNKDYVYQSKYSPTSAFVNVCKLSSQDSYLRLINMNLKHMNVVQDLVVAINLDIFNNMEVDKYMGFANLEKINFPDEITDAFSQKLQIKLLITRKLAAYQNIKYKKLKAQTKNELQVLEPALQMLHILGRLRYLKHLNCKLSKFQELSISCMQLQFSHLSNDIVAINNGEDENVPHTAVGKLLTFLMDEFKKYKFDSSTLANHEEYCMICSQAITDFVKCKQEHEIKRCSISCTQLVIFQTIYCPHCNALARNDEAAKLQKLFAPDDYVTCIYCRFLLKQDEF